MSHNDVGDDLLVTHEVRDLDGVLANAATVVLTVTRPDLTTHQPVVINPPEKVGVYEVAYILATAGRYIFSWTTTTPNTAGAEAVEAVAPSNRPSVSEVEDYLGGAAVISWTTAEVTAALAAETAAQNAVCNIPAEYPKDLAESLKRRVHRNLAMKALPLGLQTSMSEAAVATTRVGTDSEIQRLEGPHRLIVIA